MPSPVYIRAIHASRRNVPGLAEDGAYRDFLAGITGQRSSKDLTDAQARAVLAELDRQSGKATTPRPARPGDPKAPLVGRIIREGYSAGWDQPETAGAFDGSDAARRDRVRQRLMAWLQQHYPHIHGTPKKLEAWPVEALQALLEHLKGKAGARKRWGNKR